MAVASSATDLRGLEEELKALGISIVSGQQDTVIAIKIRGLAGRALVRGLQLADQLLHEKVKSVLKTRTHATTKAFTDPTFGPTAADSSGAAAMCKTGLVVPSKGGSPHQVKLLGLLKSEKIRWERPVYATDDDVDDDDVDDGGVQDDEQDSAMLVSTERVFAPQARLFVDGVCSGDVIQGNLGDCWFLSALSVVATRSDLLYQTFWRGDKYKANGLFVCRFMKNFVWHYVIIDDQLPVFGFSKTKPGKPYFARCRDPNELWVSLLEKAYAKLHGSYEALIGGFVDVALNDLTGMCAEQVILKEGFPGFGGESPFAPTKPNEPRGDAFWRKLVQYKDSGTLMGCSIQPTPTGDKSVAAESSAGNGLYFKHAYALVDAARIKTAKHEVVALVKLRNPWGMGEWTGPWSDSSDERSANQDAIEQFFRLLKRTVGANATKRFYLGISKRGALEVDEIAQDEVVDVNANDGTFFMSYDAWMQYFTHFFAGIDFPDAWHGRRVEGVWDDTTCGGNTTRSTWSNNPRFELALAKRCHVFVSLSQEDPRGKESGKIVPIGFHICSLSPVVDATINKAAGADKVELREPAGKPDVYYRLYKEKDRVEFKKGVRAEPLPPAIIPGSSIAGIDDDGTPQPAYTFKQAVSVDVTLEPGRYCIVPSMYMRTDKDTGKTNVGSFWLSVYSDSPAFRLEGGEQIAEEEEGVEDSTSRSSSASRRSNSSSRGLLASGKTSPANSPGRASNASSGLQPDSVAAMDMRRKFEDARDKLLSLARTKSIGLREVKLEFAKTAVLKKTECRRKLAALGFRADELSDDTFDVLFRGLDAAGSGSVYADELLRLFEREIEEDQMACEIPDVEDDDVPELHHQDGILEITVVGAKDLVTHAGSGTSRRQQKQQQASGQRTVHFPPLEFSASARTRRRRVALELCEQHRALAAHLQPLLRHSTLLAPEAWRAFSRQSTRDRTFEYPSTPVQTFYELLERRCADLDASARADDRDDVDSSAYEPSMPTVVSSNTRGLGRSMVSTTIASNGGLPDTIARDVPHTTERMRALERKRRERLATLQQQKQLALGDRQRTAALPRLIGGRKSGSSFASCVDCGTRVLVSGRGSVGSTAGTTTPLACAGSNCLHAFCAPCFALLPSQRKLCDACFEHERVPLDVFGAQLRALLIDKVSGSHEQRQQLDAVFEALDTDSSGALSVDEFRRALESLGVQPALSDAQVTSLLRQFDANGDGAISASEFRDWIVQDQVWSPTYTAVVADRLSGSDSIATTVTSEVLATVIAPVLDELLSAAFDAIAFSASTTHWRRTCNTTAPHSLRVLYDDSSRTSSDDDAATVVFMRTMNVATANALDSSDNSGSGNDSYSSTVAAKVFEHFDADRSGRIDVNEFTTFVHSLGLHLARTDAQLLMRRIDSSAVARDDGGSNGSIGFASFMAYVERIVGSRGVLRPTQIPTQTPQGLSNDTDTRTTTAPMSLVDVIVRMDVIAASDARKREILCDLLQQLQWHARRVDVVSLCKQLRDAVGLDVTVAQLQRLANAAHLRELQPGPSALATSASTTESSASRGIRDKYDAEADDALLELKSSGDVLKCVLFSSRSSPVLAQLRAFDVTAICASVSAWLAQQSGSGSANSSSSASVWQRVFGLAPSETIDQRDFLDVLLRSGFSVSPTAGSTASHSPLLQRLTTKLCVALALDTLRLETAAAQSATTVTFSLFTVLTQFTAIHALESRFAMALLTAVRLGQSQQQQQYIVSVALLQRSRMLRVRVCEPVAKVEMDLLLHEHEYARTNLLAHLPLLASTKSAASALATAACYPEVNIAMLALLARVRIGALATTAPAYNASVTPFLTLVESASFVATLRSLLVQADLPFFTCVSPTQLAFAIDSDVLAERGQPSFPHVVALALLQRSRTAAAARTLVTLLKHTDSSLSVRYEVVGHRAVVAETSWHDLQAALAGHMDLYAVLEVRPQGDVFATDVDRTSSTSSAAKWNCTKKIAMTEPTRCDVRIDRPVVYTDTVKVSAVPDNQSTQPITFNVMDDRATDVSSSHFVVLSVRKAQPSGQQSLSRLYCTAYDPYTACEYAVDGAPPDWRVDFFAAPNRQTFDSEWIALLRAMRLGVALTPSVTVKVLNRQAKTERVLGECEVSIGSAIAHEGHVVDAWFALQDPLDRLRTTGSVRLAFRFDVEKPRDMIRALADDALKARQRPRRRASSAAAVDRSRAVLQGAQATAPAEICALSHRTDDNNDDKNREAAAAANDARLRDLQQSLSIAESAKREALEQARALRLQLQQQLSVAASATAADNEAAKWRKKLELALRDQSMQQDEHDRRVSALQAELQTQRESLKASAPQSAAVVSNLKQAALGANASAHDILAAMKDILVTRCPERPYNGLKKALAVVAEVPGKVAFAAFDDVLSDFGLALSSDHRKTVASILDPEVRGRISIEDFFIKLCGDADAYAGIASVRTRPFEMPAPPQSEASSPERPVRDLPLESPTPKVNSAVPAPSRPKKMNWKEMKKTLLINLPEGWEARFTEKGRPYFCNHAERSTQWKHPKAEVETLFKDWLQENGQNFATTSSSSTAAVGRRH